MSEAPKPPPEVRKILGEFVRINRERYGENWKEQLAAEMAAQTAPVLQRLLTVTQSRQRQRFRP